MNNTTFSTAALLFVILVTIILGFTLNWTAAGLIGFALLLVFILIQIVLPKSP